MATARSIPLYSVNCFGSHPNLENDDCWTGDDFDTLPEAREAFDNWEKRYPFVKVDTTHVQILGPDLLEVKRVKSIEEIVRMKLANSSSERGERAMQAGMGLGIEAYNDEMGFGMGEDE